MPSPRATPVSTLWTRSSGGRQPGSRCHTGQTINSRPNSLCWTGKVDPATYGAGRPYTPYNPIAQVHLRALYGCPISNTAGGFPGARSFLIEARASIRNVNLALRPRSRAGFTLRPPRIGRGKVGSIRSDPALAEPRVAERSDPDAPPGRSARFV